MNAHFIYPDFLSVIVVIFASFAAQAQSPIDPQATAETRALFDQLCGEMGTGIRFGHQDSTLYGVGWKSSGPEDMERSDVVSVSGAYPAVYGWDMARWPTGELGEGSEELYRSHIIAAHARGGINTFSWHLFNPVTGENFYDKTPAVAAILPSGERHEWYTNRLDRLAAFTLTLKDKNDRPIPVIFRPFHEHTGSWFWWGRDFCTTDEYVALWRFTVEYLRDVKGVHQFLYAYSPDKVKNREEYFERYPGDAYVDVLALDNYIYGEHAREIEDMLVRLRLIVTEARARGKIAALSETGLEKIIAPDWFTRVILNPIRSDPVARNISYMLVWRNANPNHFFAPYPGHASSADFRKFHDDPFTIFGEAATTLSTNE
jgi:mannan endo-1,4-beta-mannosidase